MDREPFEKRFNAIKDEAANWRPVWKELAKFQRPTRGFFDERPNLARTIDSKSLIDNTAGRAARTLAAGLTSGLTSPSRPWFKLGLSDPDLMAWDPVKEWLDRAQQQMLWAYSKSNTYGVLHSMYEEVGPFGTAAAIFLDDFQDSIRGRAFTIGEYYLGMGPDCRMNTFGRRFWMTAAQLVKEFGIDCVSASVRNAYSNGNMDSWYPVCHLIEPNENRATGKVDSKNMAFRSVYWEEGASKKSLLRFKGFEDFPVLAPRWDVTTSSDVYGKGPGWDATGDTKMLQKLQLDKLLALEKIVDPPTVRDSNIQAGDVNTMPGGVTPASSLANGGLKAAYQINPDLGALENSIMRTQQAIRETYYTDLFLAIQNSDRGSMTAREIVERHEEKLLVLGPVLERLETELLDPLVDRTFQILLQNGVIQQPPKELWGIDLKVEYISMLAQAQKMVGTTAIEQHHRFLTTLAQTHPDVLDTYDADEAANEYGEMLGVPPKIMRSKETVAGLRKQKAQAAQANEAAQGMAATIQGANTLANTPLGQNSALDAILGGATGSQTGAGIPQ